MLGALLTAPSSSARARAPRQPHLRFVETHVERTRRALRRMPAGDPVARLELVATRLDPIFDLPQLLSRALGHHAVTLSREDDRALTAAVRLTVAHFVAFTLEAEGALSVDYASGAWDGSGGLVTAHGQAPLDASQARATLTFYDVRATRSGLRIVNVINGEGDLEAQLTTRCEHMLTEGGGLANLIHGLREQHTHTYPF